jgi:trans-aconitate methyltransferase
VKDDAAPFDRHAGDYELECMRGLALTGESKAYFAQSRLDFLHSWWRAAGRAEPTAIVDFGCGIGDVTRLIAAMFPSSRVYGIDTSSECLKRAREGTTSDRITFHMSQESGDNEIPRAELVHINGVLHHVAPAARAELMLQVGELAAGGGVVAVFENNPANPGTRLVMSRIAFDRDAVPLWPSETRRLLQRAGLRVLETAFLFFFPRVLSALRPIEKHLVRLPLGGQYLVLGELPGRGRQRVT